MLISLLAIVAQAQPLDGDSSWYGSLPASITIDNDTKKQFYVTIADRNQGPVDPGYAETYKVPYGDHKVVAQGWEKSASSWVKVSKYNPSGSWTVTDYDMR